MDDTAIFATDREIFTQIITSLLQFCSDYGMNMNLIKTKFMVIGGSEIVRQPMTVNDHVIEHTTVYTYLGAAITEDGKMKSVVSKHLENKNADVLKFHAFIHKNTDYPYWVNKRVLDSALIARVFYSSETWNSNRQSIMPNTTYLELIKSLLSVRRSTCNDLVLLETWYPTLTTWVKCRQMKMWKKHWTIRKVISRYFRHTR